MFDQLLKEEEKKKKRETAKPSRPRIMACLMFSLFLGHVTNYVLGRGWPIVYMVIYCIILSATGIMLKPVEEEEKVAGPKPKKSWWRKVRPWLFPILYWSERKDD